MRDAGRNIVEERVDRAREMVRRINLISRSTVKKSDSRSRFNVSVDQPNEQ
jgi:hypothetical protein